MNLNKVNWWKYCGSRKARTSCCISHRSTCVEHQINSSQDESCMQGDSDMRALLQGERSQTVLDRGRSPVGTVPADEFCGSHSGLIAACWIRPLCVRVNISCLMCISHHFGRGRRVFAHSRHNAAPIVYHLTLTLEPDGGRIAIE